MLILSKMFVIKTQVRQYKILLHLLKACFQNKKPFWKRIINSEDNKINQYRMESKYLSRVKTSRPIFPNEEIYRFG